jgi:hypothetical protein
MYKLLTIPFLLLAFALNAQKPLGFQAVDSITYQCYLSGDWDQLLKTGEMAISQGINYKRLRQRMGYAYFAKENYFASQKQYEKSLFFDESDTDTRFYLYYCGINTGNEAAARYYASELPDYLQKSIGAKKYKLADAIDLEYNYSSNNSTSRSNPTYVRAGVNTRLGYRLNLYQSVSGFKQTFDTTSQIKQPEYYALLSWSLSPHTFLSGGYHYLNTSIDGNRFNNNLGYASLLTTIDRFFLGFNASLLSNNTGKNIKQFGLQAGVTLPGKSNVYIKSSISRINETLNNRTVFSQTAGLRIYKGIWAEGMLTLGNLRDYNDNNALYVYNSIDPTTFRTGLNLYWRAGKRIILEAGYLYNNKLIESQNTNYIQQSFTGGIIWKL